MNWTGGSLSRSRKQNANLNVIQKKHFAKVRGQLLNGRLPPPTLGVSILHDLQQNGIVHAMASTSARQKERQSSQMTLDEYENVRPVVRKLQSFRPRHTRMMTPSPPIERQPHSRSAEGNHRSSSRFSHAEPHTQTDQNQNSSRSASSHFGATEVPPAIDDLEAKRRELLGTSDWMGLGKTKPLKIHFPDAEDRDLIGKRRRVDPDQNRANRMNPALIQNLRPVSNTYEKLNMRRANPCVPTSPSRISIHIGSSDKSSLRGMSRDSRRRRRNDRNGPSSDEMLFNGPGSTREIIRNEGSTQDSFRQSEHASDEMLFDREWSGIASPSDQEPPARALDLRQHPPHHPSDPSPIITYPRADTVSSVFETEYSVESQHAGEVVCDPYNVSAANAFCYPIPVASDRPSGCARTMLRGPELEHRTHHSRESNNISQSRWNKEDRSVEPPPPEMIKRPPQRDETNAFERLPGQSWTAPLGKHTRGHTLAQATAQELAELFPCKETPRKTPRKVDHGRHRDRIQGTGRPESRERENQPEENNRDNALVITEKAQQHAAEAQPQRFTPDRTIQPAPCPSQDPPAATTTRALPSTPAPAPKMTNPDPQAQPLVSQAAGPTPEDDDDDEQIWRTFVFGTENPNDDDWIFDRTITKANLPRLSNLRDNTSSPIPAANPSNESSPLRQTQPSLLAVASSSSSRNAPPASPSQSSSPTRAQPPSLSSSHADAQPSISPPKTHYSTQAQPATSSDELGPSSSPRPAAVLFRRPRRYMGESTSPMGPPIRLGVRERVRKRDREDRDGDDSAEGYGEKPRGRKRRRGEWREEVREVMEEVEEWERDEIVDD
ncbi:MAG: hypothetical protein Q9207_002338 [Kuettlingeria erythrocarpa]